MHSLTTAQKIEGCGGMGVVAGDRLWFETPGSLWTSYVGMQLLNLSV